MLMVKVHRLRGELSLEIASIEQIRFVVTEVCDECCAELEVKRS